MSTAEAVARIAHGWFLTGDESGVRWARPGIRAIADPQGRRRRHYLATARRETRTSGFVLTADTDFAAVLAGCARPRGTSGTWITPPVADLYHELAADGVAHSVEVRRDGAVVGGALVLALGRWTSIESLFHAVPDAGHAAMLGVERFRAERDALVLDLQEMSPFVRQMGAVEVPLHRYRDLLDLCLHPGADGVAD